jgi:26S proteasome regulatory subunit N6
MLTRSDRNANGLAEVITMSRAFMSSTAKAKTAKLSTPFRSTYETDI